MGRADYYRDGDYNVICDRTGFKLKRSECRKEWNNMIVRKESWEPRHPQDLLRSRPDSQHVDDPRSDRPGDFIQQADFRTTSQEVLRTDSSGVVRNVIGAGTEAVTASDL